MTNVLIIRKEDPSLGAMNMAMTPQGGFSPQLNISSGKNIPIADYRNMSNPARLAGMATTYLPAAWTALSSFADDSQGDVFSSLGRAGMGAMATRSALAPLERQAVGWAQNRYGPQPATRQTTLDEFTEPEKDAYDSATDDIPIVDARPVASPTNTPPMINEASVLDSGQNDAVSRALENADTTQQEAVLAASGTPYRQSAEMDAQKQTGENTQEVDMYGNPIKKAWRYY
jgi:hypothetical protein|tara:strand:+ start:2999 stop:3688 length:690 start_codon:yes stop_codon:yes gene_type:complete